MILGRGGARIKEMRAQSGAKIQVEGKGLEPQRQLRNVMISGSVEQRQWAAYLIAMAIQTGEAQKAHHAIGASGALGQPVFANAVTGQHVDPASAAPTAPYPHHSWEKGW